MEGGLDNLIDEITTRIAELVEALKRHVNQVPDKLRPVVRAIVEEADKDPLSLKEASVRRLWEVTDPPDDNLEEALKRIAEELLPLAKQAPGLAEIRAGGRGNWKNPRF